MLSAQQNLIRQLTLIKTVIEKDMSFCYGRGQDDSGSWKEDSLLILDITLPQATELAKAFDQAAIVIGGNEQAASIWMIDESGK